MLFFVIVVLLSRVGVSVVLTLTIIRTIAELQEECQSEIDDMHILHYFTLNSIILGIGFEKNVLFVSSVSHQYAAISNIARKKNIANKKLEILAPQVIA